MKERKFKTICKILSFMLLAMLFFCSCSKPTMSDVVLSGGYGVIYVSQDGKDYDGIVVNDNGAVFDFVLNVECGVLQNVEFHYPNGQVFCRIDFSYRHFNEPTFYNEKGTQISLEQLRDQNEEAYYYQKWLGRDLRDIGMGKEPHRSDEYVNVKINYEKRF